MPTYYDALETRDPQLRQTELIHAVANQVTHAKNNSAYYKKLFAGINAADITSPNTIAKLPITRKSELINLQKITPPFAGINTYRKDKLKYIFASPGPIFEPATTDKNYWRFARALFAAGFRDGDLVQNCFSYHLTPAGAMGDDGCHALGCTVIPGGVGNTELQVTTMQTLRPNAYIGTPSFLKIILDCATRSSADISSLKKALVSGEALTISARETFAANGISALQCYAIADLGLIAYESFAEDGLIIDEQLYLEIVNPGRDEPVADGEIGEVVVTVFNPDYPLSRFATGDLSCIKDGISQCGRTNRRLTGLLGRADQAAKVRGMFIYPTQISAIVNRHPEINRARLIISRTDEKDQMLLKCETADITNLAMVDAIKLTIRAICKVRGEVELVAPGILPNDEKVIDDIR